MHYYEILPLTKTGAEDTVFTYESETATSPGNLVNVPLRNRNVKGLIMSEVKKPQFKTRPIGKILTTEPPVTEIQLSIAQKVSSYYFCALGEAINAIFPFEFGKKRRILPNPESEGRKLETPLQLTVDQKIAFNQITSKGSDNKIFLLHGVTGSGKTEVYLQTIEAGLKAGAGSIVLVPEISLTPQTVERFEKRFGEKVAVWHSQMKETEKYHAWEKIKSGEKMVVVGARSAIFTPIKNLGYIIIDEEHESSYKQDQNPRYEAAKVAEWLTEITDAKVILGSATPRLESYQKAVLGEYKLLTLNKRIIQEKMPPVEVVDLREEYKKGNKSILSDALFESTKGALEAKKQVLLFVNRRGAATFINCRDCGYVSNCPRCEIPLTYHPSEGQVLKCHHCDFHAPVPTVCPTCGSFAIKYFGLGTQRVEIEVKKLFPKARVARMDKDTTQARDSHNDYYQGFKSGDFDILIGTQIIAKGWDLPNVSVVGVVSADTTLNIPDFRSGERTFSLLTQVAGRTGRGFHPGKVIIQTYSPENYAIQTAAKHDYYSFYEKEIKERKKYGYPPFYSLIKLTFAGTSEEKVQKEAEDLLEKIESFKKRDLEILGPVPAFIPKLGDRYRYHLILKSQNHKSLFDTVNGLKKELKTGWVVNVNPETLL